MFKKVACFTDIHFGLKNNSRIHNIDCEQFVEWFCETATTQNCDTCIFLGDWHHNRATINVSTMNYTVANIDKLSRSFEKVYLIMGNHDLYYREKREINSVPFAHMWDNVIIVNDFYEEDDVTILPWLVEQEWRKMKKIKSRYIFGHFELGGFKMNAMVDMPDFGGLKPEHFVNQEYVFSGHFHKRQKRGKVHYIGNAFPHNFADVWDAERGMMVLEHGGKPEYINWDYAPRYVTLPLSDLLANPQQYLIPKTNAKIVMDLDINYEESVFIRETLVQEYNVRDIALVNAEREEIISSNEDISFETVDEIVMKELTSIQSEILDTELLVGIYNQLHTT